MPRHIVCLGIELDGEAPFVAAGRTTAAALARGAFDLVGAPRLLDLLADHAIMATWFVPGITTDRHPKTCERIVAAGHELAHHGFAHRPPIGWSAAEEEADFVRAVATIRRLTGMAPSGYRAPGRDFGDTTIALLEAHGILYDSSLSRGDWWPYRLRRPGTTSDAAGEPTAVVELPIVPTCCDHVEDTAGLPDPHGPAAGLPCARMEAWADEFLAMRARVNWGVLTCTLSAGVTGRGADLVAFEIFLNRALDAGAVFTTMEAAAREAQGRLFDDEPT